MRLGLCFQLMGRLCFGEASLRPSAGIRVATLLDPAERVADLQLGTNGARLRTCRVAKSTQAETRPAQCVAVVAATLLHQGQLERQMSLPQRLTAHTPQRFQVGCGSLGGPARQVLCIAQRFQVERTLARADAGGKSGSLGRPSVGIGGGGWRIACHCPLPGPPAVVHRLVVVAGHEVVKCEDLGAAVRRGGGGFENLSGLRMQFAASFIGQAGVRNFPKNRVTKAELVTGRHNEA